MEKRDQARERLVEDLKKKRNDSLIQLLRLAKCYLYLLPWSVEGDFRSKLVSQEEELARLRAMVLDYQSEQAVRDRAQRDVQRMRGVITSQERQVYPVILCIGVPAHSSFSFLIR